MPVSASWQDNWDRFAELLSDHLQMDGGQETLMSNVLGKRVIWAGVLEIADLDELAPNVYIALPAREISLTHGRSAIVDGISLPIDENARASWARVPPKSQIKFKAVMGRGNTPFPPIGIRTFKSGKTVVTIRLSQGIPIG